MRASIPSGVAAAAVLVMAAAACSREAAASRTETEETAAPDSATMLVRADWLARRLGGDSLVILHVSAGNDGEAEYRRAHIPGARHLSYGSITTGSAELPPVPQLKELLRALGVSNHTRVVVYSSNPQIMARAWLTFDYLGHGDRTSMLDGGLPAWQRAGHPLTTEVGRYARGSFVARPAASRIVDAAWVRRRLGDSTVALVDARTTEEYTGADGGMGGMHLAGHIPGAKHMYWERLIESRQHPVLRDTAELRRLFEEAGAARGDTVVAYCMVGQRASVTYFVARLLGYATTMYDGSMVDWSEKRMPVKTGN
ncbi:MAG: sulfurtransferase [Gemmatimonadaceae bacterium]